MSSDADADAIPDAVSDTDTDTDAAAGPDSDSGISPDFGSGSDLTAARDSDAAAPMPAWLEQLARRAGEVQGSDLSRFLPPEDGSGRQSAVLIALAQTDLGPAVLLSERSAGLREHAGQVAFPGGSLDPADASLQAAALREAQEEVGLDPASVRVVAELPAIYIPVSEFVVTPVIAWWRDPHPVAPVDAAETAHVALVPVSELTDPANRFRVTHPSGYTGPGFDVRGLFVWGFTAGLLDRVLHLGGWHRPWDTSVLRPLPSTVVRAERARPNPPGAGTV